MYAKLSEKKRLIPGFILSLGALMAMALGMTTWSAYSSINRASETLKHGLAERLAEDTIAHLRSMQTRVTSREATLALEALRARGLRYIGFITPDGPLAEAGDPVYQYTMRLTREMGHREVITSGERHIWITKLPRLGELFRDDLTAEDRARLAVPRNERHPRPPWLDDEEDDEEDRREARRPHRRRAGGPPHLRRRHRPGRPPHDGPEHDGPPRDGPPHALPERDAPNGKTPPPPHLRPGREDEDDDEYDRFEHIIVVIEFIPIDANVLRDDARRVWFFGMLGALVMILGAMAIWALMRQRERVEQQLAEKRNLAMLGEMSATLAHELRNPLASAKGHAQLLAELLDGQERTQAKAERVVSELVRIETLTNGLLDFIRSGRITRREVTPAEVVQECIGRVQRHGPITLDASDAPQRWSMDPARIEQVLINLMRNAQQASPEDTPVRVRVVEETGRLVITVRDHGSGIEAGREEAIFEPFLTTKTRGTGLGLAVSRQIIEAHGGTITARNHPEGGALFTLRIPPEQVA